MVQKRLHEEIDEIGVLHQEPNQRHRLWISGMIFLIKDISSLEPFLRQLVRREVESVILRRNLGSPYNNPFSEAETSPRRDLQLRFRNQLASDIFTSEKIRARDGKPLQIVLCDSSSEDAIVKSGPLSSAKVDILVINGDFGSGYHGDWNEVEFQKSVLHARDGKRPLLIGILSITLKDGVGFIVDLKFTDNSAWIRGGKFRLAARIKLKIFVERVREAISEPFRVKDHRGERNKKHYPPHLEDELWRLDGVSKDGPIHGRLRSNNVITVKDFLQKIETDRSSLRSMIGRISNREWKRLVKHARTCEMDKKLYAYCGLAIIFNSIYQVVFVRFDGQDFCSVDDLDVDQQDVVKYWRQQTYKNLGDLILVDSQTMDSLKPLSSLSGFPYSGPSTSIQNSDLGVTLRSSRNFDFAEPQDQPVLGGSTSYNFEANLGADPFSDIRKSSADSYEMNLGVDSLHDRQNSQATHLINSTVGNGFASSTSFKYPVIISKSQTRMQNVFAAQQLDTAIEDDFVVGGSSFGHYNGETSRSGYLDHGEPVELSNFRTDSNAWGQVDTASGRRRDNSAKLNEQETLVEIQQLHEHLTALIKRKRSQQSRPEMMDGRVVPKMKRIAPSRRALSSQSARLQS